jgi:Putative auto-transporter adhesin, head GIN domain
MRRFSLFLVILLCAVVAATLAWVLLSRGNFTDRVERADIVVPATKVDPFKRIDVAGAAELELVQGPDESVAVTSATRGRGRIEAEVHGDTLHIEALDRERWWNFIFGGRGRPIRLVVTFRDLESIDAAGGIRIKAGSVKVPALRISTAGATEVKFDNLEARELRITGAGALRADMAGKVMEQTLSISGAGEYRGAKLLSDHAVVSVAGAGRVIVNAQRTLKATISGAGSVEYLGDPEVTEHVSGVGHVRRRESAQVPGVPVAEISVPARG